jgi:N-sulfoglucosamine sulfohydrolase
LPNTDDGPSKDLLLSYGWGERTIPHEQLYDIVLDPNEAHNLAGDPAHTQTLEELRGRLEAWMVETKDPLLEGDVPAPEGAELNDPDGLSPNDPTIVV